LGLNGTFKTNRLYRVFDKYVAVKKSEINEKVDNVARWEYNIINKGVYYYTINHYN